MGQMTVRNIPDAQFAALKRMAASNGRSAEAEVRMLIAERVEPEASVGFGTRMKSKHSGSIAQAFKFDRDQTSSAPLSFE
jgi:plasmid stability protein